MTIIEVLTTEGWLTQKARTVYGHVHWDAPNRALLFRCTDPEHDIDGVSTQLLSENLRRQYGLMPPEGHAYITDPQVLESLVQQHLVEIIGSISYGVPTKEAIEVKVITRALKKQA